MNEEEFEMLIECVDSFESKELSDGSVDLHIKVPKRFKDLWLVKLSELKTTMKEIQYYESEDD